MFMFHTRKNSFVWIILEIIRIFSTNKLQKEHSSHQSQKAIFYGLNAQCILQTLNSEDIKVTPQLVLDGKEGLEKGTWKSKKNPDGFLKKISDGFNFADWTWALSNINHWATNTELSQSIFPRFWLQVWNNYTEELPFAQHPFCRTSFMMFSSLLCSAYSFPEKLLKL